MDKMTEKEFDALIQEAGKLAIEEMTKEDLSKIIPTPENKE